MVLDAYKTFIPTITYLTPSGGSLAGLVFDEAPPLPYTGDYPFILIIPRLITDNPQVESGSIYSQGTYRLLFCELVAGVDESGQPMGDAAVIRHASLFASALSTALGVYPAGRTLGNKVAWAGWGDGITFDGTSGVWVFDPTQLPVIGIPIDVSTQEKAVGG